jgi:FAD/FMN-containing dehydrogenase
MKDHINALCGLVSPQSFSLDKDRIAPKLKEWRDRIKGETPLLLLPSNTQEVSLILSYCYEHNIPVTPQGGNTGLVGGQIPQGEILISTDRLKAVRDASSLDDVLVVEAGVTLAQAQAEATKIDRFFPLSLAAEGTATIGGVLSTNAGGTAVLRYGVARDLVLGLEAILPDGRIFNGLKRLRKDNTGYDLKQLFIGAEGTLGIITAATLKLYPKLEGRSAAIVAIETPSKALSLLTRAKKATGGQVEAFEIMGRFGLELVLKHIPGTREPFNKPYQWQALIEIASATQDESDRGLERLLETAFELDLICDATLAQNETQRLAFWKLREEHSSAEKAEGAGFKHDISVPLSRMADFIDIGIKVLESALPGIRPVIFGHIGDGNLHYNVIIPQGMRSEDFLAQRDRIGTIIHDLAHEMDGSLSAEHGLGRLKSAEAIKYKDETSLALMRALRSSFDPKRLLNPKVFF